MRASAGLVAAVLLAAAGAVRAVDSGQTQLDRFTATTVAMTPRGEPLRIDLRNWSDDGGRAAVVEALGRGAEAQKALASLPTLGYVWRSRSSVGYAIKYAHRVATPTGERITFVTDKRLGAYDIERWAADARTPPAELEYSVVELYLDSGGSGDGTLSLAADVRIDASASLVSLAADQGAPRVLAHAAREPKLGSTGGG